MRKLTRIEQLTAMYAAQEKMGMLNSRWFHSNADLVQFIALHYRRKSAMERAFVAYWIASFRTPMKEGRTMLAQIMLGYLDHSTVFCRENTLHALYALGSANALEHAMQYLNDRQLYHHPKLLSDGMAAYTGDRDALIERLWRHRAEWEECLVVAVAQFAALGKDRRWAQPFLEALTKENLPLEVRFALIRYFQRHQYASAQAELMRLARTEDAEESDLKVAAVAALQDYEGEEAHQVLLQSLHDRNWYVRRNAAQSLLKRGITEEDKENIRSSQDRYALEMLEYMAGRGDAAKPAGKAVSA